MRLALSLAVLGIIGASPLHAACTYPKAPEKLPDGSVATREEMMGGQKAVKDYDKEINAYLACLKAEYDAAIAAGGETLTAEQKEELGRVEAQKHNAAVDELESVAARFNEQVKTYKAKKDKSG